MENYLNSYLQNYIFLLNTLLFNAWQIACQTLTGTRIYHWTNSSSLRTKLIFPGSKRAALSIRSGRPARGCGTPAGEPTARQTSHGRPEQTSRRAPAGADQETVRVRAVPAVGGGRDRARPPAPQIHSLPSRRTRNTAEVAPRWVWHLWLFTKPRCNFYVGGKKFACEFLEVIYSFDF